MTSVFLYLQDHPFVGIISSVFAGLIGLSAQSNNTEVSWIDNAIPYISFVALLIGAAVGALTVVLKFLQIIKARRELKKDK